MGIEIYKHTLLRKSLLGATLALKQGLVLREETMAQLDEILKHFGTFYGVDDSQEFIDETIDKIKDVLQ